jgi:hypothetical protein
MSATDLDPNFGLPLWRALVRYFRAYPPLVHAPQQLDLPLPRDQASSTAASLPAKQERETRKVTQTPSVYVLKDLERRLPHQASSIAASDHAGKHGQYLPEAHGCAEGKVTQSPSAYLPEDLELRLPRQPSP